MKTTRNDNEEAAEIARILMESTCAHYMVRINHEADAAAYLKAMKACYYVCSKSTNGDDIVRMKRQLIKLKLSSEKNIQNRFEIFSDTKKAYLAGIDQCIDIVDSVTKRFTGHLTLEEVYINNYLRRFE